MVAGCAIAGSSLRDWLGSPWPRSGRPESAEIIQGSRALVQRVTRSRARPLIRLDDRRRCAIGGGPLSLPAAWSPWGWISLVAALTDTSSSEMRRLLVPKLAHSAP